MVWSSILQYVFSMLEGWILPRWISPAGDNIHIITIQGTGYAVGHEVQSFERERHDHVDNQKGETAVDTNNTVGVATLVLFVCILKL